MKLHQYEKMILAALAGEDGLSLEEAAKKTNLNKDAAMKAAMWLSEKKLLQMESRTTRRLELSDEAQEYLRSGFPEITLVEKALSDGIEIGRLSEKEKSIGIQWAKKNGWIRIEDGKVFATGDGEKAIADGGEIAKACRSVLDEKPIPQESEAELIRRGLLIVKKTNAYTLKPSEKGRLKAQEFKGEEEEINQLTRKMLLEGSWRKKKLREYNLDAPGEECLVGKRHILAKLAHKIRSIFTEMGFEEMQGGLIESSFWNFDALFQPQDHPARDLADTFYLEGEGFALPNDAELVKRVKRAHQKGWKYRWHKREAEKAVLRTHTTCVSARTLYEKCRGNKQGRKFFCVGKVFRNEATDYKHLAEFFQVEGIVVWEGATFAHLMGFLSEFYKKMGFEKVRFVPSYFPYTEPSLEVHVWYEPKKSWMELGGAGVFRPEVSLPLCGRYPVLAWGLSLERPLMLSLGIEDIREFYKNSVQFLRRAKLP